MFKKLIALRAVLAEIHGHGVADNLISRYVSSNSAERADIVRHANISIGYMEGPVGAVRSFRTMMKNKLALAHAAVYDMPVEA